MTFFLAACLALLPVQKTETSQLDYWPACTVALPSGECVVGLDNGSLVVMDPVTGVEKQWIGPNEKATREFAQLASHPRSLVADPMGEFLLACRSKGLVDCLTIRHQKDSEGIEQIVPVKKDWPTIQIDPPDKDFGIHALWTSDGSHFVTWTAMSTWNIGLNRMQIWKRDRTLLWTGPKVRWVTTSPTENLIAAVAKDEFWLIRPAEEPQSFSLPGALTCIAFSPDGKRIIVAGHASRMWFIQASDGSVMREFSIGTVCDLAFPSAARIAWSPNGKWIGVTTIEAVCPAILDGETGELAWTQGFMGGQMGQIHGSAWTSRNQFLFGIGGIKAMDPTTSKLELLDYNWALDSIASPPGSTHAIVQNQRSIFGLNLKTMKPSWRRNWIHKPLKAAGMELIEKPSVNGSNEAK